MAQLFEYDILNRQPANYTLTSVNAGGKTTWTLKDDLGAVVLEQRGKEDLHEEILKRMRADFGIGLDCLPIVTTTERNTVASSVDDGQMIINKTTDTVETKFDGGWI